MFDRFEKKSISFEKPTGQKTEVYIVSEIPIDGGSFGKIFKTVIRVGNLEEMFIVKKYRSNGSIWGEEGAQNSAQNAFKNYYLAKKAGLKVFPTFRIGEDKKSILMTAGFSDDSICIGSNTNKGIAHFERPRIKEIENLGKFLTAIFTEGIKAANNNISLYDDIFFFIISKTEPTKIDFVLGDLDLLEKLEPINDIRLENIKVIKSTLTEFCNNNIDPSFSDDFFSKVESCYEQNKNDIINSYKK